MPNRFNTPLARQILAEIEAHPESWNQDAWWIETECGTAFCFAGWACHLDGLKVPSSMTYVGQGYSMEDSGGYLIDVEDHALARLFPNGDAEDLYVGPRLFRGEEIASNGDTLTHPLNSFADLVTLVDFFDRTLNGKDL